MDQDVFRQTYFELNDRICVYEKSILSGLCRCSRAEKLNLAEREGVHCHDDQYQQRCERLMELMRTRARFALKIGAEGEPLSHNKAMRLQIGGLRGLYHANHEDQATPLVLTDISGLIDQSEETFGELENLPFEVLIKEIAAYKGRSRKKK